MRIQLQFYRLVCLIWSVSRCQEARMGLSSGRGETFRRKGQQNACDVKMRAEYRDRKC